MIPIIICGASGRMGHAVTKLAEERGFIIKALVSRSGQLSHKTFLDLEEALRSIDGPMPVIIDFSHHEQLSLHLKTATKYKACLLLATTGHGPENYIAIDEAKKSIPILVAPNTSLMAAVMKSMGKLAASLLKTDMEILEIHHKHKKDAPSGTAIALQKALKEASDGILPGIISMRAGEVIGEHSIYFFNDLERLELTHRVADRRAFAQGALLAAQFLFSQKPGLYGMGDVLSLGKQDEEST